MNDQNHVPCLACQHGSLQAVYESYPVRISESQTVHSAPVRFMRCNSCDDVIMHGDETKWADFTAGKNLLSQVIQQKQTLNGHAVAFLRSLIAITAKELSLRLRLDATTVSQWEGRNTTLPQLSAFAVSVFFLREMAQDKHEFLEEIEELLLKAFSKLA